MTRVELVKKLVTISFTFYFNKGTKLYFFFVTLFHFVLNQCSFFSPLEFKTQNHFCIQNRLEPLLKKRKQKKKNSLELLEKKTKKPKIDIIAHTTSNSIANQQEHNTCLILTPLVI